MTEVPAALSTFSFSTEDLKDCRERPSSVKVFSRSAFSGCGVCGCVAPDEASTPPPGACCSGCVGVVHHCCLSAADHHHQVSSAG
eukprot:4706067-Amphidinium_carterae.1